MYRIRKVFSKNFRAIMWLGIGCFLCFTFSFPQVIAQTSSEVPSRFSPTNFPANEEISKKWQEWVSKKIPYYEIPEHQMSQIFEVIGYFLDQSKAPTINFIDVGCAVGDYLKILSKNVHKPIYSLGVDPLDWKGRIAYSKFLQVAIAPGKPSTAEFNLYGDTDLACSSLARLREENVSHEIKDKNDKFYIPVRIEGKHGKITVNTVPLSQIVSDHSLTNQIIHFLKIDIQGTDLAAFLSLGATITNVLFFQIESIYSDNNSQKLYEGQSLFRDDKATLEKLGFRIFNIAHFPNGPEVDVVWVNEKLFNELNTLTQGTERKTVSSL